MTFVHPSATELLCYFHLWTLKNNAGGLFVCLRQGLSLYSWLSWHSLCRSDWCKIQRSTCLCLTSPGIKGVYHQAQPAVVFPVYNAVVNVDV